MGEMEAFKRMSPMRNKTEQLGLTSNAAGYLHQRVKAETKTASGIFLPESSVEKLNEAKVLAVGPGAMDKKGNRLPMGVAVGDRVLIPQFGGSPVKAGEEEFQLFRDSEILAKINE
ncbi:hypothetical protein LB503_003809 [Fusarium chuoi]|nr:hypothetical protein LB503_003809 [Fusarium chuoi]